jgi:hypothetical protein
LRALAALVALLLAASSLGEIAHSLLVPHAICATHGELVELSAEANHASEHQAQPQAANHDAGPAASSEEAASHDHCEVLASAQRQLPLPFASVVALLPATASASLNVAGVTTARPPLAALSVAPKTSPPTRGVPV